MVRKSPIKSIAIILVSCLSGLILITGMGLGNEQKDTTSPSEENGEHKYSNEATIWFLGHCGFALQTENYFLIFDYIEKRLEGLYEEPESRSLATGYINPDEIRDLKVRVFVSHGHGDHYDSVIFGWKEKIPDIEYFFGWQALEEPEYNYLIGPRAEWKDHYTKIYTVNSHHSGVPEVAYLVLVDGLAIYHNGDCKADYKEDIPYLKSKSNHLDIAFMPPVWEEKWDYYWIILELINKMQPKALFPMHVRVGDEKEYFAPFMSTYGPRMKSGQIVLTGNEKGTTYFYKDGRITRK